MNQSPEKIDALIKRGRLSQARGALLKAGKGGGFKSHSLAYAKLARRLDEPMLGLRILYPIIHSQVKTPSDECVCEYAASLSQVGAYREAESFLESLGQSEVKEALIVRAFNEIKQWNYSAAAGFLRKYLTLPGLEPYDKIIAETNLASALIYDKDPEADSLLSDLIERTRDTDLLRLRGHLFLIQGEYEVGMENWAEAFRSLASAYELTEHGTIDRFLIRKWATFASLYCNPNRLPLTQHELVELRSDALRLREWETLRSLDYHLSVASGDVSLATKTYFGTPFPVFRERLVNRFPSLHKEQSYLWTTPGQPEVVISLNQGFPSRFLKAGHVAHRLLLALSHDFYRPMKVAELHTLLFPSEVFNVLSSPLRVRKAVERARLGIKELGLPLSIQIKDGMYFLAPLPGCSLKIELARKVETPPEKLQADLGERSEFTVADAAKVTQLSLHQTQRLVYRLHKEGKLKRKRKGSKTRYFYPKAA